MEKMEFYVTCSECMGDGSIDVMNCSNYSNECCGGCTKQVMCECCRGMGELYPDRDDEYGNRLYELYAKITERMNEINTGKDECVLMDKMKMYYRISDDIANKLNEHISNIRL